MEPSLFTRVAVAEAELQEVKDVLSEMLDILAEVKANQDAMRREQDERRGVERPLTDQPPPPRPRSDHAPGRAPRPARASPFMRTVFAARNAPATDPTAKDDRAFWKEMARTAITGLFLLTVFVIGLYQLLRQG